MKHNLRKKQRARLLLLAKSRLRESLISEDHIITSNQLQTQYTNNILYPNKRPIKVTSQAKEVKIHKEEIHIRIKDKINDKLLMIYLKFLKYYIGNTSNK